jgi:pyridoxal phosphate enzyme (YggS family)
MPPAADIADKLGAVRRRITTAAQRAGRDLSSITLIAVSKTFTAESVRNAAQAGQMHFGENRVQEGLDKVDVLKDLSLSWHLIGHLQSNKARKAVGAFQWIHSIDSLELLRKVDGAAAEAGTRPRVLIQVDLANEATKFGAGAAVVADLVKAALDARAVELRGLMIVPPIPESPDASRPWFQQLRQVRDSLVAAGAPADRLADLSMGMSDDFEVAIEEGATMVRVGSAIFGRRAYPQA